MDCISFKEWLLNKELSDQASLQSATIHMEACNTCKALFQIDNTMEDLITKGLKKVDPPQRLLDRIEMDLNSVSARQPQPYRNKLKSSLKIHWKKTIPAFATAAILILMLNIFSGRLNSIEEIGVLAVKDHLADLQMTFNAGEGVDVSSWFEERLGYRISVPDFDNAGLQFIGGRKCHIGKSDVAYLLYNKSGKRISMFIFASNAVTFNMGEKGKYILNQDGCDVQIWEDGDLIYALVE